MQKLKNIKVPGIQVPEGLMLNKIEGTNGAITYEATSSYNPRKCPQAKVVGNKLHLWDSENPNNVAVFPIDHTLKDRIGLVTEAALK